MRGPGCKDIVDALSRLLVQQPLHIVAVALMHLALWATVRAFRR